MLKVFEDSLEQHQIRNLVVTFVCFVVGLIVGSALLATGGEAQYKCPASTTTNMVYCPDDSSGICKSSGCDQCAAYDRPDVVNCVAFATGSGAMLVFGAIFFIASIIALILFIRYMYKYEVILHIRMRGNKRVASDEEGRKVDPEHHHHTWRLHRHNSHHHLDKLSSIGHYVPPDVAVNIDIGNTGSSNENGNRDESSSSTHKKHGLHDSIEIAAYHQPNDHANDSPTMTTKEPVEEEYDELVLHKKDHGENSSIVV